MLGTEILFGVFVVLPAAIGYGCAIWALTSLAWRIHDYFRTKKEYMQKVLNDKEKSDE